MAFSNNIVIANKGLKSLALWDGQTYQIAAGASSTGLNMFNLGGIDSLEKIAIIIEAKLASGAASTFDVFWRGAATVDGEFQLIHTFWTGLPSSTTTGTYIYLGTNDYTVVVDDPTSASTGTVASYIFDVPYLGIGVTNNAGVQLTCNVMIFGEVIH